MLESKDIHILTQQLNESKRKIDLIRTVTFELNKVLSLSDKLQNILKILHDQFSINYSMILMPDESSQKLIVQCSYGYEKDNRGFAIEKGLGIMGLAALKKIPINITGIRRKKQYLSAATGVRQQPLPTLPGLTDPESQIAIPLISNNELVAVLLAESYNISVFSKEDEAFLITLSQSIAVSIQNSVLFDTMEDNIARRTEELRKSNETKDRLFSLISHDLRGPITSFHSIAKLVSHYNKQNEREKIDLLSQRIDQSVDKLNTLLDNLLNWALTQTKEIQYRPETLNLITLLNEVVDIHSDHLLQKEISIAIEHHSSISLFADYNLLTAVFRNLLNNAIKFTPRRGKVVIRTYYKGAHAIIEFVDTGIGISQDKLQSIFESHEKKSTRGTENEKGTGLGLLVAKEFTKMHNGTITVESEIARGTTVRISIPTR